MLNGLAKLSLPTMAGDSTLRELTVVSAGGGGEGGPGGTRGSVQTGRTQGLLPWGCFLLGLELSLVFYLEELILNEVHRELSSGFWVSSFQGSHCSCKPLFL